MPLPPEYPQITSTPSEQFLARLIAALIGRSGATSAVLSPSEINRMREKLIEIQVDEGIVRVHVQDRPT